MITPRKLRRTLILNFAIYYNTIFAQSVHKFEDVIILILKFNIFLVRAVHLKQQGHQAVTIIRRIDIRQEMTKSLNDKMAWQIQEQSFFSQLQQY